MDVALDVSVAEGYSSPTQIARVVTEHWAETNLFCPACTLNNVDPLQANTRVRDYRCPSCAAHYQLKSQKSAFGKAVTNSAYQPKMDAPGRSDPPLRFSETVSNFESLDGVDSVEWVTQSPYATFHELIRVRTPRGNIIRLSIA